MIASTLPSNIWTAAQDGELQRVQYLLETERVVAEGMSPNMPDAFAYTPMHAAAANGQIEMLDYLLSRGGNPNVMDTEGDTPLYFVESLAAAEWLVQHGAHVQYVNAEGVSPMTHLEADFPEIAAYLRSLSPHSNASTAVPGTPTPLTMAWTLSPTPSNGNHNSRFLSSADRSLALVESAVVDAEEDADHWGTPDENRGGPNDINGFRLQSQLTTEEEKLMHDFEAAISLATPSHSSNRNGHTSTEEDMTH